MLVSLLLQEKNREAAKRCPGFVVESNNYNIIGDESMSLISLLHGAPHVLWLWSSYVNDARFLPAAATVEAML